MAGSKFSISKTEAPLRKRPLPDKGHGNCIMVVSVWNMVVDLIDAMPKMNQSSMQGEGDKFCGGEADFPRLPRSYDAVVVFGKAPYLIVN